MKPMPSIDQKKIRFFQNFLDLFCYIFVYLCYTFVSLGSIKLFQRLMRKSMFSHISISLNPTHKRKCRILRYEIIGFYLSKTAQYAKLLGRTNQKSITCTNRFYPNLIGILGKIQWSCTFGMALCPLDLDECENPSIKSSSLHLNSSFCYKMF